MDSSLFRGARYSLPALALSFSRFHPLNITVNDARCCLQAAANIVGRGAS